MTDTLTLKDIEDARDYIMQGSNVRWVDSAKLSRSLSPAERRYGPTPPPADTIPAWVRGAHDRMGRMASWRAVRPLGGPAIGLASQLGFGLIRCDRMSGMERLMFHIPEHYPTRGYMVDIECGLSFDDGGQPIAGYHVERWFPTRRRAFKALRLWLACAFSLTAGQWEELIALGGNGAMR